MPDRIEELFAELAESVSGFGDELTQTNRAAREWQDIENERLVEGLYKNDPAVLAGFATAATIPVSAPSWLSAFTARAASQIPGLNKLYGQVGQDFTKYIIPPLSDVGRRLTGRSGAGVGTDVVGRSGARVNTERSGLGRLIFGPLTQTGGSGSRVGTDMVGRVPLPKIKDPVVTKQGPRGPINIDVPKQRSLPLEDPRYTKGLSETDREMIKRLLIPPLTKTGQTLTKTGQRSLTAADKVKIRAEIAKQERWKRGHQNKVRRGNDEYQEGSRSGYEPGIKGGEKMMRDSMKRIREIQAKIDKLNKLLE